MQLVLGSMGKLVEDSLTLIYHIPSGDLKSQICQKHEEKKVDLIILFSFCKNDNLKYCFSASFVDSMKC